MPTASDDRWAHANTAVLEFGHSQRRTGPGPAHAPVWSYQEPTLVAAGNHTRRNLAIVPRLSYVLGPTLEERGTSSYHHSSPSKLSGGYKVIEVVIHTEHLAIASRFFLSNDRVYRLGTTLQAGGRHNAHLFQHDPIVAPLVELNRLALALAPGDGGRESHY